MDLIIVVDDKYGSNKTENHVATAHVVIMCMPSEISLVILQDCWQMRWRILKDC